MSTITAQPILTYLRDRLRTSLVERELVLDPDLLRLLSEAYADICERSRCLVAFTTITFTGTQEYLLPASWFETIDVFAGGAAIREIARRDALADRGQGSPLYCYHYGRTIGFSPLPTDGEAILSYAETPDAFASWSDTLDARYPQEYAYLLVHHVRWKILTLEGGSQRIPSAQFEHDVYDQGIANLRRQARLVDSVGPSRIRLNDDAITRAG